MRIGDEEWTIAAKRATANEAASVTVERGAPTVPAFERATLILGMFGKNA